MNLLEHAKAPNATDPTDSMNLLEVRHQDTSLDPLEAAFTFLEAGHTDQAEDLFEALWLLRCAGPVVALGLAECAAADGKTKDAELWLKRSISLDDAGSPELVAAANELLIALDGVRR